MARRESGNGRALALSCHSAMQTLPRASSRWSSLCAGRRRGVVRCASRVTAAVPRCVC